MTTEVDDFLAHFGVKGMKWGVRKEPKPVSSDVQSRRDKRAEKFQVRADMAQTKISDLQRQNEIATGFRKAQNKAEISDLKRYRDDNLKDAQRKREGKLSSTQRKVAAGGIAVAAIIATAAAIKAVDSGDLHRSIIKGREFLGGSKHSWKRDESLTHDMDIDEIKNRVVGKINPDFGKFGANMNCRRSTFAYEMRRRGYDVAATKSALGTGQAASGIFNATRPDGEKYVSRNLFGTLARFTKESISGKNKDSNSFASLVENGGFGRVKVPGIVGDNVEANARSIFKTLSKMPNGARGELGVQWAGVPAGHSIAWEIVKGKPTLIDAQMNKIIDSPERFGSVYSNIATAAVTRLDNVNLDGDFLLRWLKDA